VAEGVEHTGQLSLLQQLGCDEVQGYLVSRPLPPLEIRQFLRPGIVLLDREAIIA
jgi:EAL domain-containing protein (putative c-di-GMP-specific phosphodiesterase class I)